MNDEDIKILEELKISLSKNLERLNDSDISTTMFNIFSLRKQQAQAIENLLKENKELKKNNVPVAKIKEKIEELKNVGTITTLVENGEETNIQEYFMQDEINILNELLEE